MAWGVEEQNLAVNVIAKVESSGAYDAINMRDPITVGLMQWYGSRACNVLNKIRELNPTSWPSGGVLATLTSQLNTQVDGNGNGTRWWTTRYLTGGEAAALKPILRANHDAQHQTIGDDIDDYKAAAERIYMEPSKNPQAVMYFCVMYHQTPARAIRIVNAAGPKSSIDRLYAVSMNDSVFAQYRTRYTQAKNMIKSGDAGDLIDLDDDDSPVGAGDQDPTGGSDDKDKDKTEQTLGSIKWLDVVGDTIHIVMTDGTKIIAVPDGKQHFMLPATEIGKGEKVPDQPDDSEDVPQKDEDAPPASAGAEAKRDAVVAWGMARLGKYSYTNGPARRYPEKTLSTDCSGFVKAAYGAVTGIVLGQITSSQYTQGRRITTNKGLSMSQLRKGDLIYFKWSNPRWNSPKATDHVEMYAGNGKSVGHPGPGRGPRVLDLRAQINNARRIWVQRHIED